MTVQSEELAQLLGEFAAAEREQALTQTKKQRLVVARNVGNTQLQLEKVLDENASAEEIFDAIEPFERAVERITAKVKLSECYLALEQQANQIELAYKKRAGDLIEFGEKNRIANSRKRGDIVGLTVTQAATLKSQAESIRALWERVEEIKAIIGENRRILGGGDPFSIAAAKVTHRLDALRGYSADAA